MKFFHKIQLLISNLSLSVRARLTSVPDQVRRTVPYISQFANLSWAEMVIKDRQPIAKDVMWKDSGARSIEEYERWVLSTCGMACTAMLLKYFNKGEFQTIPLARDAAKFMVYKKDGASISGMQHHAYTKWIKTFNLKATIYSRLSFRKIAYLLSKNQLVIASVNPNIRDYDTAPKDQVGGHLILITSYNKKDRTLTFHNPGGFENNNTQINHTLKYKDFDLYFSGRVIAVRNPAG